MRLFHAQNIIRGSGYANTSAVWQDADSGGGVWAVTESGLLITRNGSSSVSAISSVGVSLGKQFIELQVTSSVSSTMVGIARISGSPTSLGMIYPGYLTTDSAGLYGFNGSIYHNGANSYTTALSANEVVTIAIDAGTNQALFRRGSNAWSSARTITGTGAYYFVCGSDTGGSSVASARIIQPNSAAWVAPDATLNGYSYWT